VSEQDYLFELKCLQRSKARKRFRKDIFDSWGECAYCGRHNPDTLDHVIPKARGGATARTNLIPCCASCNLAKSDVTWFTWFRTQSFWSEEREFRILKWVNADPEATEAAKEYVELCRIPLLEPAISLLPVE
jgi:hypothetical protein